MLGALKAVFCLMTLLETAAVVDQPQPVHRKRTSVSVNVGQSATVECLFGNERISVAYWYKQTLGAKPTLMATFAPHSKILNFHDEFKNNSRFTSLSENGRNRLVITNLHTSDSATYYCATSLSGMLKFMEGTTVLVQDSGAGFPVWVYQWVSGSNQSSDSVALQCRVATGSCAGGARVYWFRESREAEAGVLYAAGGIQQQKQCVRNAGAQTHSCLYTLPMSPDPSHTGIYYCAVASCGRLLFGNGTKLEFGHEGRFPAVVIILGAALAFTSVLSLSLAILLCVMHKRSKSPAPVTTNQQGGGNQHDVQYAALQVKKDRRPTRQGEEAEPECVYSRVRL